MDLVYSWAPTLTLLGYLLVEWMVRAPGPASSWRAGAADRGTTIAVLVCLVVAGSMPELLRLVGLSGRGQLGSELEWLRPLGLATAVGGLVFRTWTMRVLGAAYSRTLRVDGGQSVVRVGPYRWVRHPGYAGSVAALTGANLATGSWLAAIVSGLLLAIVYYARTIAEERMLVAAFGQAYRDYQSSSGRLLPTRPLRSLRSTGPSL